MEPTTAANAPMGRPTARVLLGSSSRRFLAKAGWWSLLGFWGLALSLTRTLASLVFLAGLLYEVFSVWRLDSRRKRLGDALPPPPPPGGGVETAWMTGVRALLAPRLHVLVYLAVVALLCVSAWYPLLGAAPGGGAAGWAGYMVYRYRRDRRYEATRGGRLLREVPRALRGGPFGPTYFSRGARSSPPHRPT
jgi:hypothetical protein